jgi:alanine racemase
MQHARTWAEVDLGALERNLALVRAAAGGASVMLVVKADAYGHGAIPVAWHLLRHGVSHLGVGDSTEALALRKAGITAPIVVLGAIVPGEAADVVREGVSVTVHSASRVRDLQRQAERLGARAKVHLKVDTGMGRLGCAPERALGIAREIGRSGRLELDGVCTHLAGPGPDGPDRVALQLRRFRRVLDALRGAGIDPPWRHALASGGVLTQAAGDLNLVRSGIAVYGVNPPGAQADLEPALSWRTQVVFLRDHRRGARIGYGGTWRAPRAVRIATLPVGYNDGYRFAFGNRAHVLVRGQPAPVVGRVSMDYVMVGVTDVAAVRVGDEATLLGRDGDRRIGACDLARWADTVPYEILCGLGRRVVRTYAETRARAPAAAVAASKRAAPVLPGATATMAR